MKKLNFNFNFKNLSGEEIQNANAGKTLANILANDTGRNPIKFFTLAQTIFSGEEINIDSQDIELIKALVMDSTQLTAMAKAQLLEVINK